jgi:hypothetical protein
VSCEREPVRVPKKIPATENFNVCHESALPKLFERDVEGGNLAQPVQLRTLSGNHPVLWCPGRSGQRRVAHQATTEPKTSDQERPRRLTKAFSSEVDTGSREENASKQKI